MCFSIYYVTVQTLKRVTVQTKAIQFNKCKLLTSCVIAPWQQCYGYQVQLADIFFTCSCIHLYGVLRASESPHKIVKSYLSSTLSGSTRYPNRKGNTLSQFFSCNLQLAHSDTFFWKYTFHMEQNLLLMTDRNAFCRISKLVSN